MQAGCTIALAGNPNVGKSTLFNALTGSSQHVGNWPGKTVEKKEGTTRIHDLTLTVVDLPGTYSLNAYSLEEVITRDFLLTAGSCVVVAVADASNLERNLYLVTQLLELELPLIVALNMSDSARDRGLAIDAAALSARLGGTPVVETVGRRGLGLDRLRDAIFDLAGNESAEPVRRVAIDYGPEIEAEVAHLQAVMAGCGDLCEQYPPRWLAIKLLEDDEDLITRLADHQDLLVAAQEGNARLSAGHEDDAETLITDRRYHFISAVIHAAVTRSRAADATRSDRIDRVVTHPVWGVPIFMLLMWLVFQFTANVSAPFLDWIDGVIAGPVTHWALSILEAIGLGGTWFEALVVDGAIAGVGGVLVFVPVLASLYFAVAVLEDSGYMARSAFVMDRVMRAIGLPGKSFLPLMVGFGCTVPAIYATRTLEDDSDRKLTAFLTPFMSCGARLPVYVVFGAAFFGANSGNLVFAMYLVGVGVALLTGFLLKRTAFRQHLPPPFVLEMPPYRLPSLRNMSRQIGERISDFLRNAATLILFSSLVIWLLMALPAGRGRGDFADVRAEDSLFGSVSASLAPVFEPAGFGGWDSSGALITGFVAKEVVISTMSQIFVEETLDSADASAEGSAPVDDEPRARFTEDLREIATSLGEAVVLTGQEIANILPRTVNVLPGVHLAQADWLGDGEAEDTTALENALTARFSHMAGSDRRGQLAAVAFNVFVLLYVPCMAAVAAMRHEFGPRWMFYQIAYTLAVAWLAAVIVYQGGLLLGLT